MKFSFDFKKIDMNIISLVAIIVIGLTFLVSGTGKLFGLGEVPEQVVGFINAIIPAFMLTPGTIFFLYHILIPHLFPWAELILGLLIIIGFMPRLIAVLSLPLLASFLGTNIWSIVLGNFNTCADCFGIWEQIFGTLTPVQSLVYDIILLCCALTVIFFYPGNFLSSRQWLSEFIQNNKPSMIKIKDSIVYYMNPRNLAGKIFREKPRNILYIGFCIICAVLIIFGVTVIINTAHTLKTEAENNSIPISNLAVSDITDNSAVLSWTTDDYSITSVQIYDAENAYVRIWTEPVENTVHMIKIDQLKPDTIYYFKILTNGIPDYRDLSTANYFKTMPADTDKPVIKDVRVIYLNERDVSITWSTNRPATGEIEYWIADSTNRHLEIDSTLTTAHQIQLTMLEPQVTYNYIVKSTDIENNQAISEDVYTFSLLFGAEVGKRAPNFTLQSIGGGKISLSDYSGKCVMLNFWMISCPSCRHELPVLEEAFNRLPPEQTMILNIHIGGREDIIAGFIESEELTIPVLHDPDRTVTNLYSVTGVPTTFFIDSSGIIQMIDKQFTTTEELVGIFMMLLNK